MSDVAPIDLDFDLGGRTVPEGCYVILQWFDTPTSYSCVELFEDAACSTPIEQTLPSETNGEILGWVPCVGHLYMPGDTVPEKVYARASTAALKPLYIGSDQTRTIEGASISLHGYRRDTKQQICRDEVKVTIANTPAVSPKGKGFYIWEEDYTDLGALHRYATNVWRSVDGDLVGDGVHVNPYQVTYFNTPEANLTPARFEGLADAAILLCIAHGSPGYVSPVAFPPTPDGEINAKAWASALGSAWASEYRSPPPPLGNDCWFVRVKTSYFQSHWKSQRDANDAMFFAVVCFGATSNVVDNLPSYIGAAGGRFACGWTNSISGAVMLTYYTDILSSMRTAKWRSALGAFKMNQLDDIGFRMAGDGKVTLWPAPLEGNYAATFPREHHTNGVVAILFDTSLQHEAVPLNKLSGDADMTGSTPRWLGNDDTGYGVCWSYTKDTSLSFRTKIRALSDKCYAYPWTGAGFIPKKKLAGDGKSCGRDLDWQF